MPKFLPPAGGWDDLPTALMYTQPDEATMRHVMDRPKPPEKRSQNG